MDKNIIKELSDSNLNNGFVCAANDRMSDSTFSEALTGFALGVRDENTQELLDFIAPSCRVGRRFEFRQQGEGALFSDSDDARAVGADFKRISVTGDIVNSSTINRGLIVRIDNDERYDGIEEEKTQAIILRLIRNEAIRATIALKTAAGTPTSKSWLTGTKTDPDSDLIDLIESVGDEMGMDANRLIFGSGAWNARFKVYRASNSAYAGGAARDGAAQIADMLGIEKLLRSKHRFETKQGKEKIVNSNYAMAFLGCDKPVEGLDASVVKRFWTPTEGGGAFRVYREEKAKYVDIIVEHYSRIMTTLAGGAKAIQVS